MDTYNFNSRASKMIFPLLLVNLFSFHSACGDVINRVSLQKEGSADATAAPVETTTNVDECLGSFVGYEDTYLQGVKEHYFIYNRTTFSDCEGICCRETRFDECRSFSYSAVLEMCIVMNITRFDEGAQLQKTSIFRHYHRFFPGDNTTVLPETTTYTSPMPANETTPDSTADAIAVTNEVATTPEAAQQGEASPKTSAQSTSAKRSTVASIAATSTVEPTTASSVQTVTTSAGSTSAKVSPTTERRVQTMTTSAGSTSAKVSPTTERRVQTVTTSAGSTSAKVSPTTERRVQTMTTSAGSTSAKVSPTTERKVQTATTRVGVGSTTTEVAKASSGTGDGSLSATARPVTTETTENIPILPDTTTGVVETTNTTGNRLAVFGSTEAIVGGPSTAASSCPKDCKNGGRCEWVITEKDETKNINYASSKCICLNGFQGNQCEQRALKAGVPSYIIAAAVLGSIILILFLTVVIIYALYRSRTGKYRVREQRDRWNKTTSARRTQSFNSMNQRSPVGSELSVPGSVNSTTTRSTATSV